MDYGLADRAASSPIIPLRETHGRLAVVFLRAFDQRVVSDQGVDDLLRFFAVTDLALFGEFLGDPREDRSEIWIPNPGRVGVG